MIGIKNVFNNTDKKFAAYAVLAAVISLLLLSLMLMNTESSVSFDMSKDTSDAFIEQWMPRLSLPKGEYSVSLSVKGEDGDIVYLAANDGTEYARTSVAKAGNVKLKLDHDVTELVVCADKDSDISVSNITVNSDKRIFNDVYFLILLIFAGILLCIHYRFTASEKGLKNAPVYLALIMMGVFVTYPYFTNYLQYADDITFHLARIEGIKDGLIAGQFPVRIDAFSGNGYGYPTGIFYGNLFLYFPAILRILGVSSITAYKIMCLFVNIGTAFISYYSAEKITKSRYAGFLCASVYTFSTWRLICVVSRAAVGESLSMMILPLLILGIYELLWGDKNKWYILSAAFTGLLQSHIINTLIGGILTAFILVFSLKELLCEGRWKNLLKAAGLTVLLNMWFIIPFITAYTGVDMNIHHSLASGNFQAGSIIPAELFNIFNDKLGMSQTLSFGISSDMSLSLGIVPSIGFVIALMYVIFTKKDKPKYYKMLVLMFVFTALSLYMSTSLFPWDYLRNKFKAANFFENTLQFPWRFLSVSGLLLSIITALILSIKTKNKHAVTAVVCILGALGVVMFGSVYTVEKPTYAHKGQSVMDGVHLGATGEYLPNGVRPENLKAGQYDISPNVSLQTVEKHGNSVKLTVSGAKKGDYVEVPILYYPGYKATDGKNNLKIEQGNNGVIRVILNNNTKNVKISYSGLWTYKIGDIITILTLCCILAVRILRKKRNTALSDKEDNIWTE